MPIFFDQEPKYVGGSHHAAGDAVDKGAGDIPVVKTLLALKRRYWSRVAGKIFWKFCMCGLKGLPWETDKSYKDMATHP